MKNLLALARGLGREVAQRDDMGLFRLLELVALVLAVPIIAVMVAVGGDQPADPVYWLLAGAFTLLVSLFVAGLAIQHVRASRANH
ncbi:hypothetical protein PQQ65_32275 [Paraburkholderia strydomiana]|uniref:hypothetical protein n=1 Tax=Paraburkholderia strydomiana TaxID=1245417 RepID=UPI0038BC363A